MLLGLLFALLSSLCYGLVAVLAKMSYQTGLDPLSLMQIRFTLAVPMMALLLAVIDRRLFIPRRGMLLKGLYMGGLLYGIQASTYFMALETIPASTASLVISFYPALVALLAALFLHQRISTAAWLAICLVIGGCVFVFMDAFTRSVQLTGAGLVLVSAVVYSVYLVSGQVFMKKDHPLTLTFYVLVTAALTFNILVGPGKWQTYTGVQMAWGAVFGLFCTVGAITFLFLAIQRAGSAYTAIFASLDPIIGVSGAVLLLGEPIVSWQVFGMVLIVFGVALPNLGLIQSRRRLAAGHVH